MKDTTVFLVSATSLKPLNRIGWNFVVMKDIMCRYAFLQADLICLRSNIYPFFVPLPVANAWNCHSLYTAFSSNVGAWGMWACSLFLSLYHIFRRPFGKDYYSALWNSRFFLQTSHHWAFPAISLRCPWCVWRCLLTVPSRKLTKFIMYMFMYCTG